MKDLGGWVLIYETYEKGNKPEFICSACGYKHIVENGVLPEVCDGCKREMILITEYAI